MTHTRWTSDMDRRLGELWAEKHTGKRIADRMSDEFNVSLSRNAVIGRAHRLKLQLRDSPLPVYARKTAGRHEIAPPWGAPAQVQAVVTPATSPATRCKWLMGQVPRRGAAAMTVDPEPAFTCWADVPQCPNESAPEHVYCAPHCARAYHNFGLSQQAAE